MEINWFILSNFLYIKKNSFVDDVVTFFKEGVIRKKILFVV